MQKQEKTSKKVAKDGINYKKLFFELMFVLTVVFVAMLAILYPFFLEKGVLEKDKYASHRAILEEVDNYDYSKGRDLDLEKRLDEGYEKASSDQRAYFYALASATYYCNAGLYYTATDAFTWLKMNQIVTEEREVIDLEARRVLCERKMESAGK